MQASQPTTVISNKANTPNILDFIQLTFTIQSFIRQYSSTQNKSTVQ
jgi:hypothetical protein